MNPPRMSPSDPEPLQQSGPSEIRRQGGAVADTIHGPAFTYVAPRSMPLPVLIAVPHAGRVYPAETLAQMRDVELGPLRLEDRHVDRVAIQLARATGAGLLIARAPRAMLDLNRAEEDVDWDMVAGDRGPLANARTTQVITSSRARSGLGLVPRRLSGFGEIWREKLPREELDRRIEQIHRPYHGFLARELERIRDNWGAALLLDLHSMPPLKRQNGQAGPAQIVLGDRFGASCDATIVARALRYLDDRGWEAAHNRPYSGGFVLDRHASCRRGLHAMQIELCRGAYLDERLCEPSKRIAPVAQMLAGLVRELGAQTAQLAAEGEFAQAAE